MDRFPRRRIGGITGTGTASQNLRLLCPADFGDAWELKADVAFDKDRADWDVGGILLGLPEFDDDRLMVIRLQPATLVIGQGQWTTLAAVPADLREGTNSLTVRRDGATLTVMLHDIKLYTGAAPADKPGDRARIGFGGGPTFMEDTIHFKNITIRQFQPGL